jgi:ribosomal protein S21
MSFKKKSYKKSGMNRKKKEFMSIVPGAAMAVDVVEGDLSYALQQLKRRVKNYGLMGEIYSRTEYTKPSVKRRKVILDAIYKQQKELSTDETRRRSKRTNK